MSISMPTCKTTLRTVTISLFRGYALSAQGQDPADPNGRRQTKVRHVSQNIEK
jgi:hypothetical protein